MSEEVKPQEIIEELKKNPKPIQCPLCKKEGPVEDFLFNMKMYYFGCFQCGNLFTPPYLLENMKKIIEFVKEKKKGE